MVPVNETGSSICRQHVAFLPPLKEAQSSSALRAASAPGILLMYPPNSHEPQSKPFAEEDKPSANSKGALNSPSATSQLRDLVAIESEPEAKQLSMQPSEEVKAHNGKSSASLVVLLWMDESPALWSQG